MRLDVTQAHRSAWHAEPDADIARQPVRGVTPSSSPAIRISRRGCPRARESSRRRPGDDVGDLESFAVIRDGKEIHAVDFNFWGVTFTRDANRIYATLGTGGRILLVEGDVARTHVARDRRRHRVSVAVARRNAHRVQEALRLGIRCLVAAGGLQPRDARKSRLLPEPKHIDDQIEWLDDGHILYAVGHSMSAALRRADVWMLAIDGASPPSLFIADAESPAVGDGPSSGLQSPAWRNLRSSLSSSGPRHCASMPPARACPTVIDGDSTAGPSPVQMLVLGLAGCMAADVVDIVRKGRHPLTGFTRASSPSAHRSRRRAWCVRSCTSSFVATCRPAAVERAIALSRDRYCSVWHSLRQDIELTTSFDITP